MELRPDHQFNPFAPGAEAYEDGQFDDHNIDYNDPSHLQSLMGTTPPYKAPVDVRRETHDRSKNILDSYSKLQVILERHEETIHKRWTKKKKQQRLEVLTSTWPGFPATHRPDFDAFRKEPQAQARNEKKTKYRDRYIWPYINQEDLLKPKFMLLFLNVRGHQSPCEFAAADWEAMHLDMQTMNVVAVF